MPLQTSFGDPKQVRWDIHFLKRAELAASCSKDPSTKTGTIIVRPSRMTVSDGYNGFPRGMRDDPELYADRETKYSRIIHSEMNAIINAKQDLDGCTLYTAPFICCDRCAVHVIQAGIVRVVTWKPTPYHLERWTESIAKTKSYFDEAGVWYVEYDRDRHL